MIANIFDSIHGAVVYCRCEERISHARGIRKKLAAVFKQSKSPESKPLIKGLARVIDRKIQDEEFEQGFSVARMLKAIPLVITGIVAVALIACAIAYTFPLWLPLGIVSGVFFLLLIARTIRTAGRTKDDKGEEDLFEKRTALGNVWIDTEATLDKSPENKFFLLHSLSDLLIAQVSRWDEENELKKILMALEFNEIEINMLRNIALIKENSAENIRMVKKQLARMLELKIVGA